MKRKSGFFAAIAIVIVFSSLGYRVSAAYTSVDPTGNHCSADPNFLRGFCAVDTEGHEVCVLQSQNQNCTSSY